MSRQPTTAESRLASRFSIAVLAAVFANQGDLHDPDAFADGFQPALLIGAATVALGAAAALLVPRRRREAVAVQAAPRPA